MTLFILLGFFLLGVVAGACGLVATTMYIGMPKNMLKGNYKPTENTEPSEKKMSVNQRMTRVRDITEQQLNLLQMADHPQKNGLDGKYKNNLNAQVKDLEEEKKSLLVSIIDDGHDPFITTVDSTGVVTKIKLSQFMVDSGITMEPKASSEPKAKLQGKFTVYKGGKDDGNNGTNH